MTAPRSAVPARRLADVGAGSIVLAVVGAADEESLDDLLVKAKALLTFDDVRTLVIDVRATTRIADTAVEQLGALARHARGVGRRIRFAGVPERLSGVVAEIEQLGGSGVVTDG